MRRLRMVAIALAVLSASCGGGKDDKDPAASDGSPTTVAPTGDAAAGGSGGAGGAGGAAGGQAGGSSGAAGGGGATTSSTPAGQPPASSPGAQSAQPVTPLEVTLQHACVKAGGTQAITIKSPPGSAAGYDSYYADGKSGISEGFYGGNSGKQIPPEGTWTDSWTIAPHAPKGQVRVVVQSIKVGHQVARQDVHFTLVGVNDSCP